MGPKPCANLAEIVGALGPNPPDSFLQQQPSRKTSEPNKDHHINSNLLSIGSQEQTISSSIKAGTDSTSVESLQDSEADDPSNLQLHRETKDEACLPLLRMLGYVKTASTLGGKPLDVTYNTFVITSEGGLLGTDVIAEFPCVLDVNKGRFFVSIGLTKFQFFTKSTLLNLCDFAEDQGARELVFLVDRKHAEKKKYRQTLKMADACPLPTQQIWELFERGIDDASAKKVRDETSFFLMEL